MVLSESKQLEVDRCVKELANALSGCDPPDVQAAVNKVRDLALPSPSAFMRKTVAAVLEALAAQRAIALFRTQGKLYEAEASERSQILHRLEQAHLAWLDDHDTNKFRTFVIAPVRDEWSSLQVRATRSQETAHKKEQEFLRLRRTAHAYVAQVSLIIEQQYRQEFTKALLFQGGYGATRATFVGSCIQKLCEECDESRGMRKSKGKGMFTADSFGGHAAADVLIRQPVPPNFTNNIEQGEGAGSPEYLNWIRDQAESLIQTTTATPSNTTTTTTTTTPSFRSILEDLAKNNNATAVVAPLKGYARTTQKAQDKYAGDFSRILDYVRGMIIFSNIPDLANALAQLEQMHQKGSLTIVRAKDRFSQRAKAGNANDTTGGYRDCLFNLAIPTSASNNTADAADAADTRTAEHTIQQSFGIITELQFHLDVFLKIKDSVGHENYEAARDIHMFNKAFTTKSFFWEPETPKESIDDLLEGIRVGAITTLKLDYSKGLWSADARKQLADALMSEVCLVTGLSMRSCRCGDNFIFDCLPESVDHLWINEPTIQTLRLGSFLHEGTAGRISSAGIAHLFKHANKTIRVLDLEGCLDLEGFENSGDEVVEAIAQHAEYMREQNDPIVLPALIELNLKSTGLTTPGLELLNQLRTDGALPTLEILLTDDVVPDQPTNVPVGAHRRAAVLKKRSSPFLKSFMKECEFLKDLEVEYDNDGTDSE